MHWTVGHLRTCVCLRSVPFPASHVQAHEDGLERNTCKFEGGRPPSRGQLQHEVPVQLIQESFCAREPDARTPTRTRHKTHEPMRECSNKPTNPTLCRPKYVLSHRRCRVVSEWLATCSASNTSMWGSRAPVTVLHVLDAYVWHMDDCGTCLTVPH